MSDAGVYLRRVVRIDAYVLFGEVTAPRGGAEVAQAEVGSELYIRRSHFATDHVQFEGSGSAILERAVLTNPDGELAELHFGT